MPKGPRFRVTFDLTLAKDTPHNIGLIHSLIEGKISESGGAVAAWTLVHIKPLDTPNFGTQQGPDNKEKQ